MYEPTIEHRLEAAMAMWEEVISNRDQEPYQRSFQKLGSTQLRYQIGQLAADCCQEWEALSRDEQDRRVPFDWEWCPYFLTERVTWTLTGPEYKGVGK